MNLHIDKEEFDWLILQRNYGIFLIGSKLYNVNNEFSDTDYLIITEPFINEMSSPFTNHYQFQYKDTVNNIDFNFTDIITFIKNLFSGDSTVNYELLYSKQFIKSELGFLSTLRREFNTYTIIKSYLGLCDRDIRHFNKKIGRDKKSAYRHISRGYFAARSILLNNFKLNLSECSFYQNDDLFDDFVKSISECKNEIKEFRQNDLLNALQNKEINRFLNPEVQNNIVSWLYNELLEHSLYNGLLPVLIQSLMLKKLSINENIEISYG